MVHFAVDDHEVRFCTHLKGKDSWFLPFNRGWRSGAGNPPNPDGLKFDSIIVVTDRRILDQQIRDTIRQFAQVSATVGHAERSGDLRRFIESGKKIIITTVQKFPFILYEHAIRLKAEIMVDHFHEQVLALNKVGGQARAMVVTSGIERAIQYFHAIRDYRLSNILKAFNDHFGNIPWSDTDRVHKLITEDIPARVAADTAYQNARNNSDKQNARVEHDKALARVMTAVLKDDTELFKQFMDNESFRKWMTDTVFGLTYEDRASG